MTAESLHRALWPDLLGTTLKVTVDTPDGGDGEVLQVILDELTRLERIFAPSDPNSEFCRWRRGEIRESVLSPDLVRVLGASERYWVFSKGSFHPGSDAISRRWRRAAAEGVPPTPEEMRELASGLELPYTVVNGPVQRIGDCSTVDLNSIARGYVIDTALAAAWRLGVARGIAIDADGDQRHVGEGHVEIRLADVVSAEGSLGTLWLSDAAISRSSLPRSGFHVGDRWYRDVIDPRTGWPNDAIVKVVALAPDAMTADVLATIIGVGHEPAGGFLGCAWLVQRSDGGVSHSENWPLVGGTRPAVEAPVDAFRQS